MAFLQMTFHSEVLGFSTDANILVPEKPCTRPGGKWPALYLLHGYSGNHTDWMRYTALERYAREKDLVVIMPSVHNGFYTDMYHGERYWTFISEELPALCERILPISTAREDRFVAGLSMGGYGAMKLGLRCPERYAAAASLSGVVDVVGHGKAQNLDKAEELPAYLVNIFGSMERLKDSEDDLVAVAGRLLAKGGTLPKFYMACGTEDVLYQNNVNFLAAFEKPLAITAEEGPGGHTWIFWDTYIQKVLDWLPIV